MRWMTLTAVLASGISLAGEEPTRAGQIAAERDQKEQNLKAETPSKTEQRLNWVKDAGLLERVGVGYHGLRMKMGGLAPGGGFAAGPEFSRDGLAGGRLSFRAGAQGSTRGYQKQDLHHAAGFVQKRGLVRLLRRPSQLPQLEFLRLRAGFHRGGTQQLPPRRYGDRQDCHRRAPAKASRGRIGRIRL